MSTTTIQNHISHYINAIRQQYKPIHSAIIAGVLTSIVLGRAAYHDYQVYLSYGPGGMPYNVGGWLFTSTVARALSINMFDVRDFEKSPDERSWLGRDWPERPRSGMRPKLGPHPIPQRQLDQHPSSEVQEVCNQLASHSNPIMLPTKRSVELIRGGPLEVSSCFQVSCATISYSYPIENIPVRTTC
jgi:hypothetical protein